MRVNAEPSCSMPAKAAVKQPWQQSLANAIRDVDELIDTLQLPEDLRVPAHSAASLFPLIVPQSFVDRMQAGDPADPLLLQVLPLGAECESPPGYQADAVGDANARIAPGLLQKYHGRALMIATGTCAVHCRYCFRRAYPYGNEPRRLEDWEPALQTLAANPDTTEVILSGGDPLVLSDNRLAALVNRLQAVPHLRRLRIHTRLPIVLPNRVTHELLDLLRQTRLTPIMVVHANHGNELVGDCANALRALVQSGITVLNQAVLLRGINDSLETQQGLCERLINLGVIPYYLHQPDPVAGMAHFDVPESIGRNIINGLRQRLPGYAVPQHVREIAGETSKTPL